MALLLAVLAAVLACCGGHHQDRPIVETKSLRVHATHDVVATGMYNIQFNVNLPNLSSVPHDVMANVSECSSVLDVRFNNFCATLNNIETVSNEILSEMFTVFDSLSPSQACSPSFYWRNSSVD